MIIRNTPDPDPELASTGSEGALAIGLTAGGSLLVGLLLLLIVATSRRAHVTR